MSDEVELKLLKEIEKLKRKVNALEGINENQILTFQYSKIRDIDLKKLVNIEKNIRVKNRFDDWFENCIEISNEIELFLEKLIIDN